MEITGTITDGTKSALSGYRVVAYHGDVNLKKENSLGVARTGKDGKFSLAVSLARYPLGVNVRLAVLDGGAKELWSSPIHYNAQVDLKIEATIPDASLGITEYQRLTKKISSLLQELLPGAKLGELQPAQVTYLAGRSEIAEAQLNLLITAARLHEELSGVPEEAFYGLVKQGLPASIAALVALTEKDWKAALDAAARGNVIARLSRAKEKAIIEALIARKATEALRPSFPLANGMASFATVALKSNGKVQKIAAIAARHNGVNGAFWKALEHDRSITASEREKLQNHAAVSEIIGGDPELLRRVAAHLTQRGEKVTPAALTTIKRTALSRVAETALRTHGNRLSAKERKVLAESTANALAAKVAAAFPTEALRAELSAAPASQYLGRYRNELQKFFDNNGGFDMRTGLYAALNAPKASKNPFRGISDKEEVKKRLGTMARLFRALPDDAATTPASPVDDSVPTSAFTAISTLAEKEYYSSSRIAGTPRARFVADISQEKDKAYWGLVHDRATAMRDIAWLKGVELLQRCRQQLPVMRRFRDAPAEAEAGVADLRTLFGSLDMCDCEACASVTSPAAYLADILNFLGTEVAVAKGRTPYEVLAERRPDIPHIRLNCDNANREVPYIDLVNELLEDEVMRKSGADRVWAPYRAVAIDLQPSVLDGSAEGDAETVLANKQSLATALNGALPGYDFDTDMDVSVFARGAKGGVRWHLFEHGWLVELSIGLNIELSTATEVRRPLVSESPGRRATSKKPQVVHVDNISRQTYGTKAELAANPAFRNARATEVLEEARFPLSLPPGLPLLETRLFLNHLQVDRERLIKHLAPDADGWATEYLGLSAAEATLIASASRDPQYVTPAAKWGFRELTVTKADSLVNPADSTEPLIGMKWTEALSRVDTLIARAGVSYIELLDLFDTYFVNPLSPNGVRRITIQSTDKSDPATCRLSKLKITGRLGWWYRQNVEDGHAAHALRTGIGDPDDLFDRLVRFLRLMRRTGWSSRDLDLAITQARVNVLDSKTLILLAALKWTKNALRLGHAEACALFGAIDTRRYIDHAVDGQPTLPSQYEQLFQNSAVTNPVDRNFALDDKGAELRNHVVNNQPVTTNKGVTLASGKATIAAAFQITESDVTLLAEKAFQIAEADATRRAEKADDSKLSLQVLSDIYRRVLFARGFRLGIQEMIWLEELAGTLPMGDQIPAFVEQVNWLLRSKLSMTDAWFLLRGNDALTAHLVPRDEEIVQTLGELRDQLQKTESEHRTPDPIDPDGTLLRKRLGELDWGEPLIDDLLGIIADTRLFSVELASLPDTVARLLPKPGEPVSAPLDSRDSVPAKVEDLVAYDSDSKHLRALRRLTRSDRKRLLRASVSRNFRRAVELLFALGKLSHVGKRLTCRGLLSADGVEALVDLDRSRLYKDALTELADQQQQLLARKLRYCTLPEYQIDLAAATHLKLPPALAAYVYCDATRRKLVIRGQLTKAEQETLLAGATPPLQIPRPAPSVGADRLKLAGLSDLLASARPVNKAELVDLLAKASDVKDLFDPKFDPNMPATTAEIAAALLKKLTPHARDVFGRKVLVSALSTALGLATATTKVLVEQLPSALLPVPPGPARRMVDAFRAVSNSDSRAPVDSVQYAGLFDDYRRLSKIALLFQRLEVETIQLPWVFDHAPFDFASTGKWLDVGKLTSGAALGGAGLRELSELVRLHAVADRSPYNVKLIDDLLRLAKDPGRKLEDLIKFLGANTPWSESDLMKVSKALSLSKPADFISARALDNLHEALKATNQIGATAEQALQLTKPAPGDEVARLAAMLAKSLAKSKHDPERWLEIVKPINDNLREARRSALVDYLVANPRRAVGSGHPLWHDAISLYDYLLVDVQMGACMTTSRIRLALSSVQLFVQRCLMNLESPQVSVNDDPIVRRHWDEWESWRKLYRVWEANRRIFLYPENWIEPELRDDKTPFFKELENELLQNDVTQETAAAAFLNYLHKLDQVAKLEVMGIFIEEDTGALPTFETASLARPGVTNALRSGGRSVNLDVAMAGGSSSVAEPEAAKRVLHVVARTYGDPHEWFYRKLSTTREWHEGIWSPWEKIDADVTGDHILPVVWHHHLYLFWALFEKKADKPTKDEISDKDHPQEAKQRCYIKFAWSEYREGKWSPKRVSKESLRTPSAEIDGRTIAETDFSFKTDVNDSGISIKCYGPIFSDLGTSNSEEKQTPPREGFPFWTGSANSSIHFRDRDDQRDETVNAIVYFRDDKGLDAKMYLDSKINGIINFYAQFNRADWWRDQWIEVHTSQYLYPVKPVKEFAPGSPELDRAISQNYMVFAVSTQPVTYVPPPSADQLSSNKSSRQAMVRLGRFDFVVCRSDVCAVPETFQERVPDLEAFSTKQSTRLHGMTYMEMEGDIEIARISSEPNALGASFTLPIAQRIGSQPLLKDVLRRTPPGRYKVLVPHQYLHPDLQQPFFFQDDAHVYLVTLPRQPQRTATAVDKYGLWKLIRRHRFDVFYHPYVCDFIASVNRKGVDELLTLQSQARSDIHDSGTSFERVYKPDSTIVQISRVDPFGTVVPVTREDVDFEGAGSYSIYNWELFFHAPLLIATRLNANQRFSEARRWFHYIFDPTTRPGAFRPGKQLEPTQRFWNVRPFWEAQGREIHSIDDMLGGVESLSEQYAEWRQNPFKPFVVARLRQAAFMQSVVMRYLDNLIDWGDQEFSRFTMESTNEATLLYTLAAEILGRRPEKIPPRARPTLETYLSLNEKASALPVGASKDAWENFSALMVEIEAYIPPAALPVGVGTSSPLGSMWAFCVPNNGNLLEYWNLVADRLFKLRHCQDIEGVERKIPLWDPQIDPALLVRAAAAGVDLASVLTDINAALPNYRFNVLLQKAIELSNEVRNFGAALLSALEKKDGEELAQLRSRHEVELLEAVKAVKSNQVEESRDLRLAAEKSKLVAEARRDHYRDIPFLISAEQTGLTLSALALTQEAGAVVSDVFAAIAAAVPQFHGGTSGFYSSAVVVSEYGGEQVSRAAGATASVQRSAAALLSSMSALSHTVGGFQRRQQEWELQETIAQKEIDQIEKQIAAATIRESIAEAELASHNLQKENAEAIDEYLRDKYTNQELFNWQQRQLSSLYFQAYKLAYDVAKKAERAFRYELGLQESNFVQFGYWDSLKNGLLAGEKLQNAIRRMEAAYLDKNRREFEITRHVSLAELNPAALIALKEVGECEVDIPEWLFDLDYPGHYMRRIKSVALSIPCVVGPYTSVNCTLTQSFSRVRKDTLVADYLNENHFHSNVGIAQAIVTSTAREDSGLFELNFRDERYLPFEGTGAISRWRIKLPVDTNRFDLGTVSDVIFHIRYTARDGGEALREAAGTEAKKEVTTGVRVFDARTDFATEWHQFKNPETGKDSVLTLHLGDEHFPFRYRSAPRKDRNKSILITSIELIGEVDPTAAALNLSVKVGASQQKPYSLGVGSGPGDLRSQEKQFEKALDDVVISGKAADAARLKELLLLFRYKVT